MGLPQNTAKPTDAGNQFALVGITPAPRAPSAPMHLLLGDLGLPQASHSLPLPPPSSALPCEPHCTSCPRRAGKLGSGQNETSPPLPSWVTISALQERSDRQLPRPHQSWAGAPAKATESTALQPIIIVIITFLFVSFSPRRLELFVCSTAASRAVPAAPSEQQECL